MSKAYPGCVICGEHARNLRRGLPCPTCDQMTKVALVKMVNGRPVRVPPSAGAMTKSGNRPKSSGRRSDRADNLTGKEPYDPFGPPDA